MKAIKNIGLAALLAATAALSTTVIAQATEMADGEIRKVDKDSKKLTIKHGEIKHLDMPGMTMVFQVKDPALVDQVKVGDKIRFKVERTGSGFVVTELRQAGR